MPYCTKCGAENAEKADFCIKCGTKIGTTSKTEGSGNIKDGQSSKDESADGVTEDDRLIEESDDIVDGSLNHERSNAPTFACRNCGNNIRMEQERCPVCGYKTKLNISGWILVAIASLIGIPSAFITVNALLFIIDTWNVYGGTLLVLVFGSVTLICGKVLHNKYQAYKKSRHGS